jgi:hypothetical protein
MRTTLITPIALPAVPMDVRDLLGWELPQQVPSDTMEWCDLAERLARTRINWSLLEPNVGLSQHGYTRVRLSQNERWELLLLSWLPDQTSSIHGHGGSAGITRLVQGTLRETRFERLDSDQLRPLEPRLVSESQAVIEELQTIHRMRNVGREPALSLHLYSPPLRTLVEYDDSDTALPTPSLS